MELSEEKRKEFKSDKPNQTKKWEEIKKKNRGIVAGKCKITQKSCWKL